MTGIYKITSPSGCVYIGQAVNIAKRWKYYTSPYSKSLQTHLFNSFRKYGVSAHSFKIIHELPIDITKEILDSYEIFYMSLYKDSGIRMLNIKGGGSRGSHSIETRNKMSILKVGRKQSAETIEKRVRQLRGRKKPPFGAEHRKKISESRIGKRNKDETNRAISLSLKETWSKRINRGHSNETRLVLSIKNKGKKLREDTKNILSKKSKEMWLNKEHKKRVTEAIKLNWVGRRVENYKKNPWKTWLLENGHNYTAKEIVGLFPQVKERSLVGFCHKNGVRYKKIVNR